MKGTIKKKFCFRFMRAELLFLLKSKLRKKNLGICAICNQITGKIARKVLHKIGSTVNRRYFQIDLYCFYRQSAYNKTKKQEIRKTGNAQCVAHQKSSKGDR